MPWMEFYIAFAKLSLVGGGAAVDVWAAQVFGAYRSCSLFVVLLGGMFLFIFSANHECSFF